MKLVFDCRIPVKKTVVEQSLLIVIVLGCDGYACFVCPGVFLGAEVRTIGSSRVVVQVSGPVAKLRSESRWHKVLGEIGFVWQQGWLRC